MSEVDDNPPMATVPFWMRQVGCQLDGVLNSGFLEAVRDARLHLRHNYDDPEAIEEHAADEYDQFATLLEDWREGDMAMLKATAAAFETLEAYIELSETLVAAGHTELSCTITGDDLMDSMLDELSWFSVHQLIPSDIARVMLLSLEGAVASLEWSMASAPPPPSE